MNPYILLTVALISIALNAWYMGRVWLLKKTIEICTSGYEVAFREGFKYYALYMRKKLDNDFPETHLANTWNAIIFQETAKQRGIIIDKGI